jgi:hypothetical protein
LVTHALTPARLITGQITYADTNKPVAQARLLVDAENGHNGRHLLHATSDDNGQFRVAPYAGEVYSVTAYPPEGEPYLAQAKRLFSWPRGALTQTLDLALPRGVLLRGQVVEETSGMPVAGALLGYWLQRLDRPGLQAELELTEADFGQLHVRSDQDGRFRFAVAPGPGYLLVRGPTSAYVHTGTLVGGLHGDSASDPRFYPDCLIRLNPDPSSDAPELTVKLRRDPTVKGTASQSRLRVNHPT